MALHHSPAKLPLSCHAQPPPHAHACAPATPGRHGCLCHVPAPRPRLPAQPIAPHHGAAADTGTRSARGRDTAWRCQPPPRTAAGAPLAQGAPLQPPAPCFHKAAREKPQSIWHRVTVEPGSAPAPACPRAAAAPCSSAPPARWALGSATAQLTRRHCRGALPSAGPGPRLPTLRRQEAAALRRLALPALPRPQCPVPAQAGPAGSAVPWQRGRQPQQPDVGPQPSLHVPMDSARAAPRGRRAPSSGAAARTAGPQG